MVRGEKQSGSHEEEQLTSKVCYFSRLLCLWFSEDFNLVVYSNMHDQEFRTQWVSLFRIIDVLFWSIYIKGLPSELQFSWNIYVDMIGIRIGMFSSKFWCRNQSGVELNIRNHQLWCICIVSPQDIYTWLFFAVITKTNFHVTIADQRWWSYPGCQLV